MRLALALALVLLAGEAAAHPLSFGRLEAREGRDGSLRVTWRFSAAAERLAAVRPVLPARCSPVGEVVTEPIEEGVARAARYRCGGAIAGETLGLSGLDGSGAQAIVRYVPALGEPVETVLAKA